MTQQQATAENNIFKCNICGKREHIALLDAKPTYPGSPNYERFECIACYGPAWKCGGPELIKLSIEPSLKPHYDAYLSRRAA